MDQRGYANATHLVSERTHVTAGNRLTDFLRGGETHVDAFKRQTKAFTAIYVQLNWRYFEFADDIRIPHAACCKQVFESPACNNDLSTFTPTSHDPDNR